MGASQSNSASHEAGSSSFKRRKYEVINCAINEEVLKCEIYIRMYKKKRIFPFTPIRVLASWSAHA
jgi:hypothetical protein